MYNLVVSTKMLFLGFYIDEVKEITTTENWTALNNIILMSRSVWEDYYLKQWTAVGINLSLAQYYVFLE